MEIALLVLAIVSFIVGLLGCVLPVLPGPPMAYLAMLFMQWGGYIHLSIAVLVVWAIVAIVVCIIDFVLTPWMTKRFGGSKAGGLGAMVGLIVGMFLPWPFGPLFGPFAGALLGELVVSKQNSSTALKAAAGSFLSFFVGTGIKILSCVAMLIAVLYAL